MYWKANNTRRLQLIKLFTKILYTIKHDILKSLKSATIEDSFFLMITVVFFFSIYLGTYAGTDGSRKPSDLELKLAEHQGTHFSQTATALKIGRAALTAKGSN